MILNLFGLIFSNGNLTMTIKIFSSLSQQKSDLNTLVPNTIKMYVCGPTVYDDCHIGHLMGPVIFDSIARWLKVSKYQVIFVNNITDIDDKIINRSKATGEDWQAITKRYTNQYWEFLKELKVTTITDFPKCSEFISQMITYTQTLIDKGRAYSAEDGIYYDIGKQKDYGKLTRREIKDMVAGSRVESSCTLKHQADFCLWKLAKPGEPSWDSPWGKGRPGWHLECSVMSNSLLGNSFDIHGGGDDLKFPHHENELAQGEAYGGNYATYWMHNGLMQFDGIKIGKSDPRMKDPVFAGQFKARYLIDTYGSATIRFFLLQGLYRRPIDFAPQNIENASISLGKILKLIGDQLASKNEFTLEQIEALPNTEIIKKLVNSFIEAMNDDFNTGMALGHIFTMVKEIKKLEGPAKDTAISTIMYLGRLLGLFQPNDSTEIKKEASSLSIEKMNIVIQLIQSFEPTFTASSNFDETMQHLLKLRTEFRKQKNFTASDKIRDSLKTASITITDSPSGPTWTHNP